MWTTVVCKIVELDELLLCSPSAKGILMYLPVEPGRYVLKSGWVTACIWNGVHLKRGCENLTSVVR